MATFFSNSIFSILNKVINVALTFGTLVFIARVLEPDGQGKYSFLIQLSRTFFYFFSLGVPAAFVFYFGRNKEKRGSLIKTFSIVYLALIIVGTAATYFFSEIGRADFFSGIEFETILIAILAVPLWFINSFFLAIFTGLENFKNSNINQAAAPVFLFMSIVFLYSTGNLSVTSGILSYVLSLLLTMLLNIYYLKKDEFRVEFKQSKIDLSLVGRSYKYAFKTYVGSVSEFLIYRADIFIIAYFLPKSALGIYVIAVNIVERLWMISESISKVLFAKLVNVSKEEERNFFTINTLQGTFLFSIVGALGLLIFGKLFIQIFFGENYSDSVIYLYILLPGVILQSTALMIKKVLEARGYPGTNARASLYCLVINICLNLLLIPEYGVTGAAVSTSITYIVFFLVQATSLKQKFGIYKRDYILVKPSEIKMLLNTVFANRFFKKESIS